MTRDRSLRQLEAIFEDERRHLIAGDIARLSKLSRRKEELMESLRGAELPPATLKRFAFLSERNQALIVAAQGGLKSVRDRLSEIQRGVSVGTYSRSGQKSELSKPVRTLHRRA